MRTRMKNLLGAFTEDPIMSANHNIRSDGSFWYGAYPFFVDNNR